jgi:hypothetical protein
VSTYVGGKPMSGPDMFFLALSAPAVVWLIVAIIYAIIVTIKHPAQVWKKIKDSFKE